MPQVSVIIPTHSRPQLLPRAVASALAGGEDVEVIIVDDASTDETSRVASDLAQEYSAVRHVRLERNQGVAGARNVGLLASTGEYIAFLDDDDLRLPGTLDLQVAALENFPEAGLACGIIIAGDGDCNPTPQTYGPHQASGDLFWEMVSLSIPILPIAVLVRRECFLRVGLFQAQLAGIDDWDMWARISEVFPLVTMPDAMCIYRTPEPDSGQGSSNLARHMAWAARHQLRLLQLRRAREGTPRQRRHARQRFLDNITNFLLHNAAQWAHGGGGRAARANLLMALRLNPRRALRVSVPGVRFYSGLVFQSLKPRVAASTSPPATSTCDVACAQPDQASS